MHTLVDDVVRKVLQEVQDVLDTSLVRQTAQTNAALRRTAGDDVLRQQWNLHGWQLGDERRLRRFVCFGVHRAVEHLSGGERRNKQKIKNMDMKRDLNVS